MSELLFLWQHLVYSFLSSAVKFCSNSFFFLIYSSSREGYNVVSILLYCTVIQLYKQDICSFSYSFPLWFIIGYKIWFTVLVGPFYIHHLYFTILHSCKERTRVSFSTSLLTLVIFFFDNVSHPHGCEVVSHGFLSFP